MKINYKIQLFDRSGNPPDLTSSITASIVVSVHSIDTHSINGFKSLRDIPSSHIGIDESMNDGCHRHTHGWTFMILTVKVVHVRMFVVDLHIVL